MEDFVNIIGVRHSRIKDVLYEYYVLELWPAMIKSRAKTFFFLSTWVSAAEIWFKWITLKKMS